MSISEHKLGQDGEKMAVGHLKAQGYAILEENYRCKLGEIDIIVKDGDTLCFVEVKTRTSEEQGHPLESITPDKQRKIIQVANYYLQENNLFDEQSRFDVVAVIPDESGQFQLELIQDAFDCFVE